MTRGLPLRARQNDNVVTPVRMLLDRQVTSERGEQLAREQRVMFIETSSKQGTNVKQMFRRIAGALPNPNVNNAMQSSNASTVVTLQPIIKATNEQRGREFILLCTSAKFIEPGCRHAERLVQHQQLAACVKYMRRLLRLVSD